MNRLKTDQLINQAVDLISQSQNYQHKLFYFLCCIFIQIAFNALISPLIFTNPIFTCHQQLSTQTYACRNLDRCTFTNNFTGTYYSNLYCQHRDARMMIQSIFAIGCIIGMLTVPALGDIKGKKFGTSVSLLCMLAGNLLIFCGIYTSIYPIIALGMFLSAYGSSSMAATSYSLISDFFSPQLRQTAILYFYAAWGLTDISVALIWYLIPNWKIYLLCILSIPIIGLFIYFRYFFVESVHFLVYAHRDIGEIEEVMVRIAEINQSSSEQLEQSISTIIKTKEILAVNNQEESTFKQKIGIIIKNKRYLKAVIFIALIKLGYYCFYYGTQGSLQRLGFNLGISISVVGLGEVTGYMTGSKFIPNLPRKSMIVIATIGTAAIGLTYTLHIIQNIPLLGSIILYICFIFDSWNFSAICLLQSESFQSSIKSTAVGTIYGTSYISRFFAPYMIGFLNQEGIHPIIAASVLMISIAVIPIVLVDQTYTGQNSDAGSLSQNTKQGQPSDEETGSQQDDTIDQKF